ncbi:MAG: hypothetical protein U5N56_04125 [Candidatus Marinimicrobia bacterium]|nr:hypothetical protein [Candidatus Neomarinimicrobiota bacterium]
MRLKHYILFLFSMISLTGILCAEPANFLVIEQDTFRVDDDEEIQNTLSEYLIHYGNDGYPFVELILDSYNKSANTEFFHYRLAKGEKVTVDTVVFGEYSPREISLLSRYISLPQSGNFHYSKVREMINELRSDPLINVEERVDIYQNGVRFYTEAKQNIRFDAVAAYKEETAKRGIVGNISCELVNLGGLGRLASFYWSRPSLGVNMIDISYTEPYILNKPFSLRGAFSQRYQDSLYVKRDLDIGVIYHIDQRSHFRISYQNEYISTTQTGSDSGFVTRRRSGSDLSLYWTSPRKSIYGYINARSGIKLASGDLISRSLLDAGLSIRKSRLGINMKILGGLLVSREPIALYDKFKLGGAEFLRGAYFEQFITDKFIGWQLESGYFYDNTRMFFFYDGALIHNKEALTHHIGIGFSLPAAKNRITIAVGFDPAESIQQAKFHLSWDMGQQHLNP